MNFVGSRYYTLNRVMLSSIGLWPYQTSRMSVGIQRFACLFFCVSLIVVQLLTFTTYEYSLDLLLEVLSYTIPVCIVILKYVAYWLKIESLKELMETIKHDWDTLKNETEHAIIEKYTYMGAFYAQLFALIAYTVPPFFVLIHLMPNFLDLVAPLNQSRPHQLIILTEYFVDTEKYFYLILLHAFVTVFFIQSTLMSTTSIYVAYIQHACGMFEIACYRIEHALDSYGKGNLISGKCCPACNRIIGAIDIHRRAIEFFEFMKNTFVIMYFILLIFGVASLTVSLCRAVIVKELFETAMAVIHVFVHLFYFFIVNYTGQKILDHSSKFFSKTYKSEWQVMPLHVQKIILFILQRSSKNCMLLIGGLYIVSLEGFATAMSTSVSYFMVIYSTR